MGHRRIYITIVFFLVSIFSIAQKSEKQPDIHNNQIVIKLKSNSASNGRIASSSADQLEHIKSLVKAKDIRPVFKNKQLTNARSIASGLQHIYKVALQENPNIWMEIKKLEQSGLLEYAEPVYQNEVFVIPSDPEANPGNGQQDHLAVIKAYDAWDIQKSDTSMIIGIVDTGAKMDHEDLKNVAFNYGDPIDGIDNDGDGYIDNFYGWDLSDEDNDPTADGHPHGTAVTGFSSAATNNGIGIAGVGFNARYLPVKIAETSSQKLTNEYEGIIYAADHGCKVINLSWGGEGAKSRYGQDVINYAVFEKDVVVIAAAGNTAGDLNFYPASFDNVLSVGASNIDDQKASWATHSHFIDIMAPGDNVYTTSNDGGYGRTGGSSHASPQVAGAAALVRSQFPELDAIQVMEQLRVTADDIYHVGSNMNYYGQLGKGRLNVEKALSDILTPSVRLSDYAYESNHKHLIFPGDTVRLKLTFTNYLRIAENLTITVSNASGNVSWESDEVYIQSLAAHESHTANGESFMFVVNEDVKPGESLWFRVDYLGNYYEDFQYFEIGVTPDCFDVSDGVISSTIASDGDIGFDKPYLSLGNGISYKDNAISYQAGIIISQDSNHVMDNLINDYDMYTREENFIHEKSIRLYDNSIADIDARSTFGPKSELSQYLPIKIEQKVLTWEKVDSEDGYLVFEYRIINTGDSSLHDINTGIFVDWDLANYTENGVGTDAENKMGYTFDKTSENLYSGLAMISNQDFNHCAIDIADYNSNIADIDNVFSKSMKHDFITGSTPKTEAGVLGNGNDVAQILGANGLVLEPKQSTKVVIAMLASNSLDGLRNALSGAKAKYIDYVQNPPLLETFYACIGDSALVDPEGGNFDFYSDPALTNKISSGPSFKSGPVTKDSLFYVVNLDSSYQSDVYSVLVKPGNPQLEFAFSENPLLIEENESANLKIENSSVLAETWHWDLSNGFTTTVENPLTKYSTPGTYPIKLVAKNEYGCTDSLTKDLIVAIRSARPALTDYEICRSESVTISASNSDSIKIYSDSDGSNLLFAGNAYQTAPMMSDTVFYATNANGAYESLPVAINIKVLQPQMGFDYSLDTVDLENKYSILIWNSVGSIDSVFWHIDNEFISSDPGFSYIYSSDPFEISQIKISENGCRDTLRAVITPSYSQLPVLEDMTICNGIEAVIRPTNGSWFHFYADEELSSLIHKGSSYKIDRIEENRKIYVTGMDNLLESSSTLVNIFVDEVEAKIEVVGDSILQKEPLEVEIHNVTDSAFRSYWLSTGGAFDDSKILYESFDEAGSYNYILVAKNDNNCTDTLHHQLRVQYITGLEEELIAHMNVFPNPAENVVTIEYEVPLQIATQIDFVDINGQIAASYQIAAGARNTRVNIDHLPPGIYMIKSKSQSKSFGRFIKK